MASKGGDEDYDMTDAPPNDSKPPTLSCQIIDNYATSKFDDKDKPFLPAGYIDKLVTIDTIIKELDEKASLNPGDLDLKEGSQRKKIVNFVLERGNLVFAIAVVSGLRGWDLGCAMWQFLRSGFDNDSLPATERHLELHFGNKTVWNKTRLWNFYEHQWKFLAPVFSPKNFKVELLSDHVLPFIEKSSLAKEGAFGQVFMVKIHPYHQVEPVLDVCILLLLSVTKRKH